MDETRREFRTVGGRRYNLDTAKVIGKSAETTLYKKKNGEFFLHRDNTDKIESLIFRDARKWAAKNLTQEEFASAFEYGSEKKPILYNLPEYAVEKLRTMAADRRKSASQILTDLIMSEIDDVNEETIPQQKQKVRLMTAQEGAEYIGVSLASFKRWADGIGATRHIGKSVRYDIRVIDDALDNMTE